MLPLKPLSGDRYMLLGSATGVPSTMKQYLKVSNIYSLSVMLHTPVVSFSIGSGASRMSLLNFTLSASGAFIRKVIPSSVYSGETGRGNKRAIVAPVNCCS